MSWKVEIFRAILLALGVFEVITNLTYLIRKNGMALAKKQHGELPFDIPENKLKVKVILMFSFGLIFFLISVISYMIHGFIHSAALAALVLFAVYALIEALYYRYWRTFGFASVTIILLTAYIIL